jgi:cellulose synthase/poly-beta-1,6-N-acetylglucosamine synthase-like glycosyltransferase
LAFSFNRAFRPVRRSHEFTPLNFSIIIAAKNESGNVKRLAESLNNIDYPKGNYEIIFVDDGSSDATATLFQQFINKETDCPVISSAGKPYEGKKGALSVGIEKSKYPFILITDADCVVPACWLKACAFKFSEGYDFIIGAAPFFYGKGFANLLSCFENLRSVFLSFSLAGAGLPYNAAARNLGFKREAFLKAAGYRNTTETISGDDDLLLREMAKKNFKIGTLTDSESFVFSDTAQNLKSFFRQRARHTATSFHYALRIKAALAAWHGINLFFLFSPVLFFLDWKLTLPFFIKIISDVFIVLKAQKKINYKFSLFAIAPLQVCYELLLIISFVGGRFFKVKWK